jgi:hypothetical protein
VDTQTARTVPDEAAAPSPQLSQAQIEQLQAVDRLVRQFRSGASWFYWIAGLSLINSLI